MPSNKQTRREKTSSTSLERKRSPIQGGDVALVRWIADGRVPALGAFYDRWSKHVNSIVDRTTRDSDDAERIVDATFWYAWNTAASYDASRISVGDWLQNIVRRKSVEQLRLQRISRESLMSARPDNLAPRNRDAITIVKVAIPHADLCAQLRRAVSAAAIQDAESMTALRTAVCDYTVSLRNEGIRPEGVLISIKTMIQNRSLPPSSPASAGWYGTQLHQQVSTWSIEEFFRA